METNPPSVVSPVAPAHMPIEAVKLGDRERKDYGELAELGDSIRENGIIQPIVVDENCNIVDGGRRYSAAKLIGLTHVPVILKSTEGSELKLRIMEFAANEDRKDYDWKERCRSVANIYQLAGREKWIVGQKWTHRQAAKLLNISTGGISEAIVMTKLLEDPKHPVHQATSMMDALAILLQIEEDRVKAYNTAMIIGSNTTPVAEMPAIVDPIGLDELLEDEKAGILSVVEEKELAEWRAEKERIRAEGQARVEAAKANGFCIPCEGTGKNSKGDVCFVCKGLGKAFEDVVNIPLSTMFTKGNSLAVMDCMGDECVNHIVSDPPYAIDTDMMDQAGKGLVDIDRTKEEHKVEENLDLIAAAIPKMFRILKPGGFCVLYYDNVHWKFLEDALLAAGFAVQRWPLIWLKPNGLNQCAQYNFTKATEFAIVARKRLGMLIQPQALNYGVFPMADKKKFSHPYAKPVELHTWILRAIAMPGQIVFDPFMGSGTLPYAAAKLGLSPRGAELIDHHYNETIINMQECYTTLMSPRKVTFS